MYWEYSIKNMSYQSKINAIFWDNNKPKHTPEKKREIHFQRGIFGYISVINSL